MSANWVMVISEFKVISRVNQRNLHFSKRCVTLSLFYLKLTPEFFVSPANTAFSRNLDFLTARTEFLQNFRFSGP